MRIWVWGVVLALLACDLHLGLVGGVVAGPILNRMNREGES